jgi:CheY-like chemotaxis protein
MKMPFAGRSFQVEPQLSDTLPLSTDSEPVSVLICEDNVANQSLLRRMCTKLNLLVDVADNGVIGVEKVRKNQYALVFMDLQMPEMGGLEATEKIRTLGYTDLPIVAVTSNTSECDRQSCIDAGMDDFMAKPINMNDLSLMVKKCVA